MDGYYLYVWNQDINKQVHSIDITKGLIFKNEVFLHFGSVRPSIRTRLLGPFRWFWHVRIDLSRSNFQGLYLWQLGTLWKAKQLYNQYLDVRTSISKLTKPFMLQFYLICWTSFLSMLSFLFLYTFGGWGGFIGSFIN